MLFIVTFDTYSLIFFTDGGTKRTSLCGRRVGVRTWYGVLLDTDVVVLQGSGSQFILALRTAASQQCHDASFARDVYPFVRPRCVHD